MLAETTKWCFSVCRITLSQKEKNSFISGNKNLYWINGLELRRPWYTKHVSMLWVVFCAVFHVDHIAVLWRAMEAVLLNSSWLQGDAVINIWIFNWMSYLRCATVSAEVVSSNLHWLLSLGKMFWDILERHQKDNPWHTLWWTTVQLRQKVVFVCFCLGVGVFLCFYFVLFFLSVCNEWWNYQKGFTESQVI